MRDRRTLAMLALLILLVALGAAYLFLHRDGEAGGWGLPAAAVVLLVLLVAVSAGASRGRRVVRDEEEIDPQDRRDG
jgi:peptidoglycan/LPS O-acetylase OafA/YrhL